MLGQKIDVPTLFQFSKKFLSLSGKAIVTTCFLIMASCQTTPPPVEEYVLARSALDAAFKAGAPRLSHGHWQQAEKFFKQAEKHYQDRSYNEAKSEFIRSRKSAEKAENATRFQKFKNGEFL